jgi:cyclopropane fatty-acyl-phospholipid synthase-like methyltransferase
LTRPKYSRFSQALTSCRERLSHLFEIDLEDNKAPVEITHAGGLKATEELVRLCKISRDKVVLDVGCGPGESDIFIVQKQGSNVVGIDASPEMIVESQGKKRKRRLDCELQFLVADAQNIPFREGVFDAVIAEAVTAILDKKKAVAEYVRVTKSGGSVGMNEVTWLRTPSEELKEKVQRIFPGTMIEALTIEGWTALLMDSGLGSIQRFHVYDSYSGYGLICGHVMYVGARPPPQVLKEQTQ